ncbi:Nucleoid-associated protein Lsr2 [Microbacterium sp. C448]|uniref:histone-like nucleoid-structuring protein Lsr2 n=1 Tax=Microbacterium TaxID=33882 RepID=UPI0003DE720A|nr:MULTISPECIES: Lsr2 family protein [Microbacterium]CDK00416.1 Nucleoid-associated protein Lsr2 [Microbacterium sp. C448]|tara:strand:+ start:1303 stop:1659 length:357 start_codon:yes stop_codon:yes gene_type:complete
MARRIVHQLVDDIDGTVLDAGEGETVLFSLDGIAYEIDLTEANAGALRDTLQPYVAAARSISSRTSGSQTAGSRPRRRSGQQDFGAIRQWARDNGHQVSDRGRVPANVIEAFEAAQES